MSSRSAYGNEKEPLPSYTLDIESVHLGKQFKKNDTLVDI